jgi:tRNA threonylcarbamoyladenosine biosynthesis protein TsaE
MQISFVIHDLKSLEFFSGILANMIHKGDYILFHGEIGAGKTTLIKFIAKSMGINERYVSSPSFVIINEYKKDRLKIFHIDIYRLGENTSISDVGLDDYYLEEGIVFIEWAEYLNDLEKNKGLHLKMEILENEGRKLTLSSNDPTWFERLEKLQKINLL